MSIVERNTGMHLGLTELSYAWACMKSLFFAFCPPFILLFTVEFLLFVYSFKFFVCYVLVLNPENAYPGGLTVRDLSCVEDSGLLTYCVFLSLSKQMWRCYLYQLTSRLLYAMFFSRRLIRCSIAGATDSFVT